jgi:hypothetical protein
MHLDLSSKEAIAALIGVIGALVAAVIGGFVAFISLIVNKEQSVSGFRQAWIDALRQDIANLLAHVIGAHGTSITQQSGDRQLWGRIREDFVGMNETIARIKLRLNPNESRKGEKEATQKVLAALDGIDKTFQSDNPNWVKLKEHIDSLIDNSRVILKENWDRVRSGEPAYVVTKWITLCTAILILVGAFVYIIVM